MLDNFFIKELFNVGVLELRPIVTSNSLDLDIKLILGSFCKLLEDAMYFTLVTQKEYPSETRIIINNYKTIFVTTNAYISDGSKYVHVKQLQWPFGCHNILDGMFSSLVFPLGMRYKSYLSQKKHLLVQGCVSLFKVWLSSSSQHGQVGDAITNPC